MSDSYIAFFKRTDNWGDYPIYDDETWDFFESKEDLINFIAKEYAAKTYKIPTGVHEDFKLTNVFALSSDIAMEFILEGEKAMPKIKENYERHLAITKAEKERKALKEEWELAAAREECEWRTYQELKKKYGHVDYV